MHLSTPIYRLKTQAKQLAREKNLTLTAALDHIAAQQGFSSWSQLAATHKHNATPALQFYRRLKSGDIALIGARPAQGKTLFSLELASTAIKLGYHCYYFSLEMTRADFHYRLDHIGEGALVRNHRLTFDNADDISADYIVHKLKNTPPDTTVVVDFMQLLDQKRQNPDLHSQIQTLKRLATRRRLLVVLISQIDRRFDLTNKVCPDLSDIRLPNHVNLSFISHSCFMHNNLVKMYQHA